MLKLLIPILNPAGALEAARHGAFLFAERCVSEVKVVEVLAEPGHDRTSAFWSTSELRRQEKLTMLDALMHTRAILDDAGVPYTWKRVFGAPEQIIANCANEEHVDIVVLDASRLGFLRRWGILSRLRRLTRTPVTLLQ